ncbi:hypothetical protein PUN28_019356 [Cardiocondyla obscurior]|uniref:Uncharacterized protein n=1 Tax=Cardiocondyla obscurior TaxID=286306 RepID=A0AAW2EH00_9HYME
MRLECGLLFADERRAKSTPSTRRGEKHSLAKVSRVSKVRSAPPFSNPRSSSRIRLFIYLFAERSYVKLPHKVYNVTFERHQIAVDERLQIASGRAEKEIVVP